MNGKRQTKGGGGNMTKHGEHIKAVKHFCTHPYAWPGGYPLYAITSDGAALCAGCVKMELGNIVTSIAQDRKDGWKVEAVGANWEEVDLFCDHCSKPIESAYGDN